MDPLDLLRGAKGWLDWVTMADDKSNTGGQDRARINVNEDYELRDWSTKFGVTPEELKEAVKKVGPMADDVKKELGK